MEYTVISNVPNHSKIQAYVTSDAWEEFMFHDPVSNRNWSRLHEWFSRFQFSFVSKDDIIGVANSIPIYWDKPFDELPEEGWDWAFQKGVDDHMAGIRPNVLVGLQICVSSRCQGKGVSQLLIKEMISLAENEGYSHVLIPVRPNLKDKYPLTPIDDYIKWTREDGLPFDPWLRVHARCGGRILKPCHKAMYIPGSISEWEEWTGMKFPASGDFVVKGALVPVNIDITKNLGQYIEPNVWVVYALL